MNLPAPDDNNLWVFGYGSLIYKVDFPWLQREPAEITGWTRRFWQGSHDHRGTPQAPGRVVTLVPQADQRCRGMAWRISADTLAHLDHREKNGYERHRVSIRLLERQQTVSGLLYLAGRNNPAFLGPAPVEEMARHIAGARGPSGTNSDYLLRLEEALRRLGDHDEHVMQLAQHVRRRLPV